MKKIVVRELCRDFSLEGESMRSVSGNSEMRALKGCAVPCFAKLRNFDLKLRSAVLCGTLKC